EKPAAPAPLQMGSFSYDRRERAIDEPTSAIVERIPEPPGNDPAGVFGKSLKRRSSDGERPRGAPDGSFAAGRGGGVSQPSFRSFPGAGAPGAGSFAAATGRPTGEPPEAIAPGAPRASQPGERLDPGSRSFRSIDELAFDDDPRPRRAGSERRMSATPSSSAPGPAGASSALPSIQASPGPIVEPVVPPGSHRKGSSATRAGGRGNASFRTRGQGSGMKSFRTGAARSGQLGSA